MKAAVLAAHAVPAVPAAPVELAEPEITGGLAAVSSEPPLVPEPAPVRAAVFASRMPTTGLRRAMSANERGGGVRSV